MEVQMKHVDFTKCSTCKFNENDETEYPCNECLEIPAREYSMTPEFYKKAK